MRSRFDEQLDLLNEEMINMGAFCESAIATCAKALDSGDIAAAEKVQDISVKINHKEREIEALCMKLILQQQPVARDLRTTMFEYDNFDFNVITQPDGDVKSNLIMRALESFESIKIIRQAIANIPEGKVVNRDWEMFDTDIVQSYIEVP